MTDDRVVMCLNCLGEWGSDKGPLAQGSRVEYSSLVLVKVDRCEDITGR